MTSRRKEEKINQMVESMKPLDDVMRKAYMMNAIWSATEVKQSSEKKASLQKYVHEANNLDTKAITMLKWYVKWSGQRWDVRWAKALRKKLSKKSAQPKKSPGSAKAIVHDSDEDKSLVAGVVRSVGQVPEDKQRAFMMSLLDDLELLGDKTIAQKIQRKKHMQYLRISRNENLFSALQLAKFYARLFSVKWESEWTATITKPTVKKTKSVSRDKQTLSDKSGSISKTFAAKVWAILATGAQDVTGESLPPSGSAGTINTQSVATGVWLPGIIIP